MLRAWAKCERFGPVWASVKCLGHLIELPFLFQRCVVTENCAFIDPALCLANLSIWFSVIYSTFVAAFLACDIENEKKTSIEHFCMNVLKRMNNQCFASYAIDFSSSVFVELHYSCIIFSLFQIFSLLLAWLNHDIFSFLCWYDNYSCLPDASAHFWNGCSFLTSVKLIIYQRGRTAAL